MTTSEAFEKLISKRGWYNDLGIPKSAGQSLAKRFKESGSISIDKMEELLEKARYKVFMEKQWVDPAEDVKELLEADFAWCTFNVWERLTRHMFPADTTSTTKWRAFDQYFKNLESYNRDLETGKFSGPNVYDQLKGN